MEPDGPTKEWKLFPFTEDEPGASTARTMEHLANYPSAAERDVALRGVAWKMAGTPLHHRGVPSHRGALHFIPFRNEGNEDRNEMLFGPDATNRCQSA